MAKNIYGLDLGTYEIKIYDKKKDKINTEKNALAIMNKKEIFALGNEAYEMYEKAPDNIEIAFPMRAGVISRFDDMQILLQKLLKTEGLFQRGGEYVIAAPTDVTEVEKRAFFELVIHSAARAKEVNVVERGLADAIGLDLDVEEKKGIYIANFGGETTELTILSQGGVVVSRLLKIGGVTYDNAVATVVRRNHDFLIGRLTSETLRHHFNIFQRNTNEYLTVAGRNLITGVPCQRDISIDLVRFAIKEPLQECVRAMKSLLERAPSEVLNAIQKDGIYITGGIANMKGLKPYLQHVLKMPVTIAQSPEHCAIRGLKKIVNSKELSKKTYSMQDNEIRWMR